jgi:hypothetical protein
MDLFSNGLLAQLVERAPDNCVVVLGLWRGSSHINSRCVHQRLTLLKMLII